MNQPVVSPSIVEDRRRSTRIVVIVNTVLCALAILPSFAVQLATVMGGAAPGAGNLGAVIAIMGLLLPAVPVVSIAGSWVSLRWRRVALAFVALPWLYAAALGIALIIIFNR